MSNNRVAIYCRLSKEDEKEGESESIQNQKSMLLSHALRHEWEVVGVYADDDFGGTDSSRPEWNKMLAECEKGNIDIVLCKTQSRFSRDMSVIEKYIHGLFLEWKVRFVSIVDNADSSNKGNKKARQIMALTNEWYVEEISDNIRAVFKDKMSNGEYIATFPPYGYKKDTERKNHLVIDVDVAPTVKQIFDWHISGKGAQTIARLLNEQNIPNPRKYQEIQGLRKTYMYAENEIGLWQNYTVRDILKNQTYCGDTVQHRIEKISYKSKKLRKLPKNEWIIAENTHEPITSAKFPRTDTRFSRSCLAFNRSICSISRSIRAIAFDCMRSNISIRSVVSLRLKKLRDLRKSSISRRISVKSRLFFSNCLIYLSIFLTSALSTSISAFKAAVSATSRPCMCL
jgi:DNA invertase Pin-like site-specific DNA recombinase